MGNSMNLLCNEVPRNWNMKKKGTNIWQKVWVPVSQALSHGLGLLHFLRLWKIDGKTLTFICHLTKFANFFLRNPKRNTAKPGYRDLHCGWERDLHCGWVMVYFQWFVANCFSSLLLWTFSTKLTCIKFFLLQGKS